jgi:hypothetical protein
MSDGALARPDASRPPDDLAGRVGRVRRRRRVAYREGNRRATVIRGLLEDAGVRHRLSQGVDGRTWTLRVGRVRGDQVVRAIEDFLW